MFLQVYHLKYNLNRRRNEYVTILHDAETEIWDLEVGIYKLTVDHTVGNGD